MPDRKESDSQRLAAQILGHLLLNPGVDFTIDELMTRTNNLSTTEVNEAMGRVANAINMRGLEDIGDIVQGSARWNKSTSIIFFYKGNSSQDMHLDRQST